MIYWNTSTAYAKNPLHFYIQLRFTTIDDLCMCCGSYLHVARSFFISQVPCTQKLLLISAQGIAPPTLTPPTNTTESIRWIKYVISDYRKCLHICLYMCLLIVWFMCLCVCLPGHCPRCLTLIWACFKQEASLTWHGLL